MARRKKTPKPKPVRTPQEEEALAKKRAAALDKARKVRAENQAKKVADQVWPKIRERKAAGGCRCKLKKGMTIEQLRKLGGGCTMPRWACPTLTAYRRLLEDSKSREE